MSDEEEELLRKIYFYRVAEWSEVRANLPKDVERIENLPWTEAGRYYQEGDGSRLALWPDTINFPLRLKFGRTRIGNLPLKEQAGKLESLNLAVDQGLIEICHIIIYEEGYVAAEHNFSGPRINRLSDYLYSKHNELTIKLKFLPLFQQDIISVIENMSAVTLLELSGRPTSAALLSSADMGLSNAIKTLAESGAEKTVRLGLSSERGKNSKLQNLAVRLAAMVHKNRGESDAQLRKLRIQGFNAQGKIDAVDLLEQHLVSFKSIEKVDPASKALSTTSAYAQIDAAYKELRDTLQNATFGQELSW